MIVGLGLFAQCLGDTLARLGTQGPALPLFFLGLIAIVAPCAWRLTTSDADRRERIQVSLLLGLSLLASYWIRSPLIFDGFDELLHMATLTRLVDTRTLFATNTLLPVSPYYPGLELLTVATKWVTGLPLLLSQLAVLVAARAVLVIAVFLVVERVCGSPRAGGIGVLVYAASPQFYFFNAQYAYQTLALAFAAGVVYFLLVSIDQPRPETGRLFALSMGCVAAVVVTHHLTSWLTVAFLLIEAAALALEGRRAQARVIGLAAGVGVVVTAAWTALVGHRLFAYLSPIFHEALSGITSIIENLHGNRQLFHNAAGGASPVWEIVTILAATAFWCLILLPSAYAGVRKGTIRGGRLRYLPVVIAITYPAALAASFSSSSEQVGGRATTFIFFAMSVVVGGWLSSRIAGRRRLIEQGGTIAVAVICFLGSMMYGSGPDWSYVPGPYLVGADARSVTPASLAAAEWASTHLVVGSNIAADVDNSLTLDAIGHLNPVTSNGGVVYSSPLFFNRTVGPYVISLIRKADIRYLLIDERLATGLPLFGTYIQSGEPDTRLTLTELNKWNYIPGARRIYDNGPIRIYDLAGILGISPTASTPGPIDGSSGTAVIWIVLALALVTSAVWLVRFRRLRGRIRLDSENVLFWVLSAMVAGLFGAFIVVPSHLPPRLVGLAVLAVLLAFGLRPLRIVGSGPSDPPLPGTEAPDTAPEPASHTAPEPAPVGINKWSRRGSTQLALTCAGLAFFGVGCSSLISAAERQWNPPAQMSVLYNRSGRAVVSVELGSAGPIAAKIQVTVAGEVVYSRPLLRTTRTQSFALPSSLPLLASQVQLYSGNKKLRQVDG